PKQKKSVASNTASAEPEDDTFVEDAASGASQKAKSAGSVKAKAKPKSKAKGSAASRDSTPADKGADAEISTHSARDETPANGKVSDDADSLQIGQVSIEPEALSPTANAETDGKKTPAKGGSKTSRKKATPKEKKPRAKSKSAGAKAKSGSTARSGNDELISSAAAASGQESAPVGSDETPLAQNADYEQDATSVAANGSISISPSVSNAGVPMQSQASPVPQNHLVSTPLALASQANSAPTMANASFEHPRHITKEYLQANPHYYAILRSHMMAQAMRQRQQQQQQPGVPNIGSPNPLGSPQIRPGVPPNAAAIAQMLHMMHSGNGSGNGTNSSNPANAAVSPSNMASALGASSANMASALGAGPTSAATLAPQIQPNLMSPAMRPSALPTTAAGGVPPGLQLQPTQEDIILIRQYCQFMQVPLQSISAQQLAILITKAKTGELKQALLARIQARSQQQQQQQQQTVAGANSNMSNSGAADAAGSKPQQQSVHPANAGSSAQNSPVVSNALPMNANGVGLSGNIGPGGVQSANPIQLPPELANLPPQERMRLLEMMIQRQRAAAANGTGAHMQAPVTSIQQQALVAAIAMQQQQQQQRSAAVSGGSLSVSTQAAMASPGTMGIQTPTARPMRPSPGATGPMQSRPLAAAMGSPTPAPS
ncbi:hypothetical protein GGI22_006235, partial [Coemansia erecta]